MPTDRPLTHDERLSLCRLAHEHRAAATLLRDAILLAASGATIVLVHHVLKSLDDGLSLPSGVGWGTSR